MNFFSKNEQRKAQPQQPSASSGNHAISQDVGVCVINGLRINLPGSRDCEACYLGPSTIPVDLLHTDCSFVLSTRLVRLLRRVIGKSLWRWYTRRVVVQNEYILKGFLLSLRLSIIGLAYRSVILIFLFDVRFDFRHHLIQLIALLKLAGVHQPLLIFGR